MLCGSIPLLSDNIVEESESFLVVFTTTDPSVIITRGNATFVILDDTSEQKLVIIKAELESTE